MGAPDDEPEFGSSERPQHRVSIAPFLLGRYPVTQAQWRVVASYPGEGKLAPDPSTFKGDDRPVTNVSWDDATAFCRRLSARTGKNYRLPSEAQWEYACRAGTTPPFHFGETLTTRLANYDGNYTYNGGSKGEFRESATDVGSFPANRWGMHDMHGNVWEWCEDDWHENYDSDRVPTDGSSWVEANREETLRLLRGGSWDHGPWSCRSAVRGRYSRDDINSLVGFRVCCVPPRISS